MAKKAALVLAGLLTLARVSLAQEPPSSWKSLTQLKEGDRIEIINMEYKQIKVRFVSFSNDSISFRTGKGETAMKREDVYRVLTREKPRRAHSALVGICIGGGITGTLGGIAAKTSTGSVAAGVAAMVGAGVGIGALIGAALPVHTEVYRAPERLKRPKK